MYLPSSPKLTSVCLSGLTDLFKNLIKMNYLFMHWTDSWTNLMLLLLPRMCQEILKWLLRFSVNDDWNLQKSCAPVFLIYFWRSFVILEFDISSYILSGWKILKKITFVFRRRKKAYKFGMACGWVNDDGILFLGKLIF